MKKIRQITALLLATLVGVLPLQQIQGKEPLEITPQEDFYTAINKEWLDTAKVKEGYTNSSNFTQLSDQASSDVQILFDELLQNASTLDQTSTAKKMVNLYKNYMDKEARNVQGMAPIQPYLEKVQQVKSVEDYTKLVSDETMIQFNPLYSFQVAPDMKDSNSKCLTLVSTSLRLNDADYYTEPTEIANKRQEEMGHYLTKLFQLAGYSKKVSKDKVAILFAFEKEIAASMMGTKAVTTHPNIYEAIYNVYTLEQLEEATPQLQLTKVMKMLGYDQAKVLVIQEPLWLQTMDTLYNDEHIEAIKTYMEAVILQSAAPYLSDEFVKAHQALNHALLGVEGELPLEQQAFQVVNAAFEDEIGRLYVEKYFSKEGKDDVEMLVEEIIDTYKQRIKALDWMSEATKQNALLKLETMQVKIGYPDKWEDFDGLVIKPYEEGGNLFENMLTIQMYMNDKELKKIDESVDKQAFLMPPQTVNACYSPLSNDITFPAAILRAPFYDINSKKEANMGAIGMIIAHEITHAFDNTGARFDEKGNLKNWWTEEDYRKFEEKAQKVRDYYSKIEALPGQYINGDLTVGENIADIGAMACMLDIMEDLPAADYKTFFESWARVWRMVAPDAYKTQLLQQDSHAPNKARVNEVVKQFEVFHTTYEVEEQDAMYLGKDKRLSIW